MIQACGCPPSCEATGTPPPGGRLLRRCPVGCRRRSPRRGQLLLDSIGSVRSAVGPIASILGMAPGEARARGGATRNNDDDVCAWCHARTPGDPCRVCGHGSAATTDDAAAAADAADSPTSLEALRAAGIPPPPPQPRESVNLPGFAPARFRSNSPLHDGDAAALRERSAADDRAEAGLE